MDTDYKRKILSEQLTVNENLIFLRDQQLNFDIWKVPTGDKGVRMHEDYMTNYFIIQYDAITDIDFTSIFESLLEDERNRSKKPIVKIKYSMIVYI